MSGARADSGEAKKDATQLGRHPQQRLLEPDERACLTCVRLAGLKSPHRPEHQRRKPTSRWTAVAGGRVPAGSSLVLLDDDWQTFPPVHGGFDSRHYLFRIEDGPLAGRHLYAEAFADWVDEAPPPPQSLWPDGVQPDDGGLEALR